MLSSERYNHYDFSAELGGVGVEVCRYLYESYNSIYNVDYFNTGLIRYTRNGKDVKRNNIHDAIIRHFASTILMQSWPSGTPKVARESENFNETPYHQGGELPEVLAGRSAKRPDHD